MPERPIECSECRRELCVNYKEVLSSGTNCYSMCAECPVLARKFAIAPSSEGAEAGSLEPKVPARAPILCERCRTSLDGVERGEMLGCADCYQVFGEVILAELRTRGRIPSPRAGLSFEAGGSLHLGSSPGQAIVPTALSSELSTLNEALNEALQKENYEQAAWIRDRIKTLLNGEKPK